jgi:hypothetical protein
VLVGVVVLHAPRCSDGMIAAMASPAQGASAAAADMLAGDCGLPMAMAAGTTRPQHPTVLCTPDRAPNAVTRIANNAFRFGDVGGFLGSCLAFAVTILAAVAGLYPCWSRSVWWLGARRHATSMCTRGVRVPSLTQLCILRT